MPKLEVAACFLEMNLGERRAASGECGASREAGAGAARRHLLPRGECEASLCGEVPKPNLGWSPIELFPRQFIVVV